MHAPVAAQDPGASAANAPPIRRGPGEAPGGFFHMGLGLLLFGVVIGLITGLSNKEGTGQTALTSVLGFVGGSLLTWTGFRRLRRGVETQEVDPRKVGIGLSCISTGLMVGLFAGMFLRFGVVQFEEGLVRVGHHPEATAGTGASPVDAVESDPTPEQGPAPEVSPVETSGTSADDPGIALSVPAPNHRATTQDTGRPSEPHGTQSERSTWLSLSVQANRNGPPRCLEILDKVKRGFYETEVGKPLEDADKAYFKARCVTHEK